MKFTNTKFKDAFILEIEPFTDERGFLGRSFCSNEFKNTGLDFSLAQSSISYNKNKDTLRGMHFQKAPFEEIKIVSCTKGSIFDVIIDLRPNSSTYCQWDSIILSDKNFKSIYIPKGFAHGFQTLEDNTIVYYQMSEFFNPEYYDGVLWNDSAFNIRWPKAQRRIISQKDMNYNNFNLY